MRGMALRDLRLRDGGSAARRERRRLCRRPPPPRQGSLEPPPLLAPLLAGTQCGRAAARPVLTSRAGQSRQRSRSPARPPPAPPRPPSGSLASGTPRRRGPTAALRGGLKKPAPGWWDPARPPSRRAVIGSAAVAREGSRPPWRQVGARPVGSRGGRRGPGRGCSVTAAVLRGAAGRATRPAAAGVTSVRRY